MASLVKKGNTWYVVTVEGKKRRWKSAGTNEQAAEKALKVAKIKELKNKLKALHRKPQPKRRASK